MEYNNVGIFPDCARDIKYYAAAGLEFPLICDGYGNYQSVQHSNKLSYCVDKDGFAVSDYFEKGTEVNCNKYLFYEVQWESSGYRNIFFKFIIL